MAGATTTYYAYGQNGLLYGEYSSTGTLVKEYLYLDSQPLAQITAGSPEVLTYLHTDNLGTPRYATNTAGTQVWAWPTDAFGVSTPTGTVTVNLRMPGQFYDSESGLFYNWNRYYNPNIGRYISPDPIGQEGGLNLFSYVGQSPIMGSDPMGLAACDSSIYTDCINPVYPIETVIGFWYGGAGLTSIAGKIYNFSQAAPDPLKITVTPSKGSICEAEVVSPTSGQLKNFEQQFQNKGIASLEKSKKSFIDRVAEHELKIQQAKTTGGFTSSMEREIRNFKQQIRAIDEILFKHGG